MALLTLTFLEIILGIDNIVFISIAANKLPENQRSKDTNIGLLLAMVQRIILLFFVIAILYSSVGFGGGSSYLAILALTGIAFTQIRAISLLCNIVVVGLNVFYFQRQKLYDWKKVIPMIAFSIPLAFVGGFIQISEHLFFILLGCTLLIAAITMWFSKKIISSS